MDEGIRNRAKDLIRNADLPDNEYIWVNWIQDYSGGDNYAIRLVHPNQPETEGMYLNTSITDNKGNFPYLEELNGVKNRGEILFEYYFKKPDSDEIYHKLSYAKLYKPFDWVVATGIYLDDIDMLVEEEQGKMEDSFKREFTNVILVILIALGLSIVVIILFEKQIHKLISGYTSQIEELAYKDSLTGLLNRRAMIEDLKPEISRAKRTNTGFCLIMADIDHFKRINDTYGHPVGDAVLTDISDIIMKNIRTEDRAARWGGEEFLIMATSAGMDEGISIVEKIRKTIASELSTIKTHNFTVTITFGITTFKQEDDIDSLLSRADKNLYKGKTSGRNKVVFE
jgi:diguanylate cyclase (GGDEF)-like protein